ncbi:S41 family peptidase [uncultured Aquimarina sp.]|uniref:S41 family peptidase n=1 Tax=uncultured Aquimarina sp. TaxID=575652 RepID=UPI002639482C|nr:S41 family peptidase [uncultured Aquimarina sp.]
MKHYTLFLLVSFYTLICTAQNLQLEKASPFTAVIWEEDHPIVKFEGNWYKLVQIEDYKTDEILSFCKQQYSSKWKKRFSEDLVEVLKSWGVQPMVKVKLLLANKSNEIKEFVGTYTYENRQKVLRYNRDRPKQLKTIKTSHAIDDIDTFYKILKERSSYIHLSDYNYHLAIESLRTKIATSKTDIDINYLTHELAKILATLGDRHSYVINEAFDIKDVPDHTLQLPFSLAVLQQKVVALKLMKKSSNYTYLYPNYPYLKAINDIPIYKIIDSFAYRSKKAPKEAKLSLGSLQIQQLGKLYFRNNLSLPKQTRIIFSDGIKDTTVVVKLQNTVHKYVSKLTQKNKSILKEIKKGNYNSVSKIIEGHIAYIKIPQMRSFKDTEGFKGYLDKTFKAMQNTKAMIIDLRHNPGGTRDIIQLAANYLIPKSKSPWVANVAYLRTNHKDSTHKSMTNRYLYTYEAVTKTDKKAITEFNEQFSLLHTFDKTAFSNPHYMVLHAGDHPYTKPVYILVDEYTFSAASVFTSVFKGLPNVKIVGVTTDGSSGNSKKFTLKHSDIKFKISTMLSFQRNGKTLDGNGTKPDIVIERNEKQVLEGEDYQLQTLIEMINFQVTKDD